MKERIQALCKQKGVTMGKAERELGFAKGYLSKIGQYTPSGAKLQKIADYFGVTVDYLMNGAQEGQIYYTGATAAQIAQDVFENPDLRLLLDAARDVSPDNIRLAAEMLRRFKQTND